MFFRLNSGIRINYFVEKRGSELNISAAEISAQKPLFSLRAGFRYSVLVSQGRHYFTDQRLRMPDRLAKVLGLYLSRFGGKTSTHRRTSLPLGLRYGI